MQSGKALNVARTWSDIVKSKASEPDVISRNEFLGTCAMSKQNDQPDLNPVWLPMYGPMRTESSAISHRSHQDWSCRSAVSVRPSLPPGLEPPPGLEMPPVPELEKETQRVEKQQKKKNKIAAKKPLGLVAPEPERFQVLLQNLPQMMLNDTFLRAMLDQAMLKDVIEMIYRPNGKAIVTFGTYDSMCLCIEHLHGRQWGGMPKVAITATYVRLVKSKTDVQKPPTSTKPLSADAPSFVPGLLAAAANLHPSADKMCESGDKWNSRSSPVRQASTASTEPGSADHSDECDSDMEQQLPVARA